MDTQIQVLDLTEEAWFKQNLVTDAERWLSAVAVIIASHRRPYSLVGFEELAKIVALSAMMPDAQSAEACLAELSEHGWPYCDKTELDLPASIEWLLLNAGPRARMFHIDIGTQSAEVRYLCESQEGRRHEFEHKDQPFHHDRTQTFTRIPQPVLERLADLCEFGF